MALLDDLKGLLSPAEFAKIQGNSAVATRLARGEEWSVTMTAMSRQWLQWSIRLRRAAHRRPPLGSSI
jgi:hypothetical protein